MRIISHIKIIVIYEYLKNISADQVYLYLKLNAEKRRDGYDGFYWEIEELLFKHNDPLINLGLAQYGYNLDILKKLYLNGDKPLRLAALMNKMDNFDVTDPLNDDTWVDEDIIKKIISEKDENEKAALLINPSLGVHILTKLFKKHILSSQFQRVIGKTY